MENLKRKLGADKKAKPYTKRTVIISPGLKTREITERVTLAESIEALRPLLAAWAGERDENEGFGDFYQRTHVTTSPRRLLRGAGSSDVES